MLDQLELNTPDELHLFQKQKITDNSYVYIVSCDGSDLVKVGHTSVPLTRFKQLKTQMPFKNNLIYAVKCPGDVRHIYIEKLAHKILADNNQGGEWFNTTDKAARLAVRTAYKFIYSVQPEASLSWGAVA